MHAHTYPGLPMHTIPVDVDEQGLKLIRFLARRLAAALPPPSEGDLHRWIRTGQVRVNGGRARAFDRLNAGDLVRVPPFAAAGLTRAFREQPVLAPGMSIAGLKLLAVTPDILALEKPSGLPTQPGTGHEDCVASRLQRFFTGLAHVPAPAHRLDKATSGIVLAGRNAAAQQHLHTLFASPERREDPAGKTLTKAYLAWVGGAWPQKREAVLEDYVAKETLDAAGQREAMRVVPAGAGQFAQSLVAPVHMLTDSPHGKVTLLRITLHTGRTHQIRIQLASRGYPVIGDAKYGGAPFSRMLLHAYALECFWNGEAVRVSSLPDWPPPFAIRCVP